MYIGTENIHYPDYRRVPWLFAVLFYRRDIIRCSLCRRPAVKIDPHYPYMSGMCRCRKHADYKRYPVKE
jgi:hypothetical protein